MLKIENRKKTFFQALRVKDCLPVEPPPHPRTSKASSQ